MEVRKLIKGNEIVGFRVKYNNTWYDISVETALKYNVYDKFNSVASKTVKLISQHGVLRSQFEMSYNNYDELVDENIISQIAINVDVNDAYYLMLKNNPILHFNLEDFVVKVLDENLLPYQLRGIAFSTVDQKVIMGSIMEVKSYLSNRVLSLQRKNAKQILNLLKLSQSNNVNVRCNIALYCKGLSLTDSYWVKKESSNDTWEKVNLFSNHLDEALIDVSLTGVSFTPTTSFTSPELTTKGLFKKAWVRDNGNLYLYKSDDLDTKWNTKCERIASDLLDELGVKHCEYKLRKFNDLLVVSCKCLATDKLSMITASELKKYCNDIMYPFESICESIGGIDYHNMFVVDYLLCNTDRHDENWGFFMNNATGELDSLIPLYDHNLSLVADIMGTSDDTMLSNFKEFKTLKEAALFHLPYCNINLEANLDNIDFMEYFQIKNNIEFRIKNLLDLNVMNN